MSARILIATITAALALSFAANTAAADSAPNGSAQADRTSATETSESESLNAKKLKMQSAGERTATPRSAQWHIKMAAKLTAEALKSVEEGNPRIAYPRAWRALKLLDVAEGKFSPTPQELKNIEEMRAIIAGNVLGMPINQLPQKMSAAPAEGSIGSATE